MIPCSDGQQESAIEPPTQRLGNNPEQQLPHIFFFSIFGLNTAFKYCKNRDPIVEVAAVNRRDEDMQETGIHCKLSTCHQGL